MGLNVINSLKINLEELTEINTVILYDGIKLPKEKPFITIDQLTNTFDRIAKQKESVRTNHNFRVGVFAKSLRNRYEIQQTLRDIFSFYELALYNEEGINTGRKFEITSMNEIPLSAEDISSDTDKHRVYFDIEIQEIRHKNRGIK